MRAVTLFLTFILSKCLFAAEPILDAPPASPKLASIFNRFNLIGWEGDPRLWTVKDGFIRGEVTLERPIESNSFLIWRDGITRDFELRLAYRTSPDAYSGVQYRSTRIKDPKLKNMWSVRGYQFKIRSGTELPNAPGYLYDEGGKRGRMCLVGESASMERNGKRIVKDSLLNADAFKKLWNRDSWNDVVIIAIGNKLKHYLNGRLIVDFTDNNPLLGATEGVLALELAAGKPMWVEFRDVRIRDISEKDLVEERESAAEKAKSGTESN